jgi:hypothetical protein
MNAKEYLETVLFAQDLKDDSAELKELQSHRAAVEKLIRKKFGSTPVIRYGGSKAKGTFVKEAYDLDIVCYFPCNSDEGGKTLEEIYKNVRDCLAEAYYVEERTSALRLRSKDLATYRRDFHIDVIPGRFTDETQGDCFIYQKSAEKCRLKTNLDVHLEHIKDSGVLEAIRLLKLWKTRRALRIKQFVFELLIIELLEGKKSKSLADQLTHVWTEIANSAEPMGVKDPANQNGNDLSAIVKDAWPDLQAAAASALASIKSSGWEAVFGAVSALSAATVIERTQRAAASVSTPTKPWCDNA